MNSIAIIEAVNTTSLPFHGQHIITAMAAGVAYVAMRPIVENLGMSWSTQVRKLMGTKQKFNCVHMNMVAMDSKLRDVLCIPLKKLNGWLFSINPAKVRDDIRDRLVRYQEECFTALHDYWTKGAAIRKPETTVDDRTPLRGIVNRIMGKYGMTYQAVYKLVHKEFGVKHIDELSSKQTAEAVEYLAGKVIEGEFLGKGEKGLSSFQFTDEDLCRLAWLWDIGNRMQDFAKELTPAMYSMKSAHAGKFHDFGKEFRWTFEQARVAIEKATLHIPYQPERDDNWSRVLPRLRKEIH
ncbi:phage antirepressor N-terminal domain-containing protein [Pantoea sp. 1.19]|uniref:phage antirepressor N-terminal domain-containing protein n=1 Tax=Pantoea sp. 1.19 TaxID=1925589 RepID=UPI0009490EAD|nr:phage antirepressor N-terminal domain-containing protein [Pantoea sp. 1.19]